LFEFVPTSTIVSEEILSQFLEVFEQASEQELKIPNLITRIEAPAIQLIPIAVYV